LSASNNPYDALNFLVEIDGVTAAAFTDCTLPSVQIDQIDYREGNDTADNIHKIPGLVRFGHLILKRGLSSSPDSTAIWDWLYGFVQGKGVMKGITVSMLDEKRVPVFQWTFTNAWPTKYEAPPLSGRTSAFAIETLEVVVDTMTLTLGV
jgi:phage tail-like protein